MLFCCSCIPFNRKHNQFRKTYRSYIIDYIKNIIEKTTCTILLVIIEGGGLLDDYHIIINLYKNYGRRLPIEIIIVEPDSLPSLLEAHNYFVHNVQHYVIGITIVKKISLQEIKTSKHQAIIVTSFDPYYFSIDTIFKNFVDDMKELALISYYCMVTIFYTKLNKTLWEIFLWNHTVYKTHILQETFSGNNTFFLHTKQNKIGKIK
jgi:hypothetical protein